MRSTHTFWPWVDGRGCSKKKKYNKDGLGETLEASSKGDELGQN